jgi:hypothetical protein
LPLEQNNVGMTGCFKYSRMARALSSVPYEVMNWSSIAGLHALRTK